MEKDGCDAGGSELTRYEHGMEEGGDAQIGAPATADVETSVKDAPSLEPNR